MRKRFVRSRVGERSIFAVSAIMALVMVACAKGTDGVDLGEGDGGDGADGGGGRDVVVIPATDSGKRDTGGSPADSATCDSTVVINELKTDGPGPNDEFVELYNPSACDVPLGDWEIKYQSSGGGAGGAGYKFKAGDTIAANAFFLVASSSFSGSKDATLLTGMAADSGQIGLLDDKGAIVDSVAYGTWTSGDYRESQAAPKPAAGGSVGRSSDGVDTDNNKSDFKAFATPSPGASN